MAMAGTEWIESFAAQVGADAPDTATIELLLELAGVAAHGSERIAAPIACWLVGSAGIDPARALSLARGIGI